MGWKVARERGTRVGCFYLADHLFHYILPFQALVAQLDVTFLHDQASQALIRDRLALTALAAHNLRRLSPAKLCELLHKLLPADWVNRQSISSWQAEVPPTSSAAPPPQNASGVTVEWLKNFWRYISSDNSDPELAASPALLLQRAGERADALKIWPLLPLDDGTLLSLGLREAVLVPPARWRADEDHTDESLDAVLAALRGFGVPFVHPDFAELCAPGLGGLPPSDVDALQAALWPLYMAEKAGFAQTLVKRAADLQQDPEAVADARRVFAYFCQHVEDLHGASELQQQGLRALPIYPALQPNHPLRALTPATRTIDVEALASGVPEEVRAADFVAADAHSRPLYQLLGVPSQDVAEAVERFLLPRLGSMSGEEVMMKKKGEEVKEG